MPAYPASNKIVQGDCVERMMAMPAGQVDLAFADPPFNIGYEYDVYHDKKEHRAYVDWSRSWISAVYRALADSGTFWLAIGDEYAAELKLASQEIGFHSRSWVIWYYTFGVNCKNKFSRSHAHLFYFVKDPKRFTFRADELENRIPSARQLVYADNRANPTGRLPDDTWVLRPQDLAGCFTSAEDTWYFPRVAGTFKERAGFHGCQMPEQLLGRIIKLCSSEGDLVLDPFSGSATTLAVAKKLGRRYLGFELSAEYVTRGTDRLEAICVGDPLDGAAEPTVSAPSTAAGKIRGRKKPALAARQPEHDEAAAVSPAQLRQFHDGLLAAYRGCYEGFSLDRVVADPAMNERLGDACLQAGLAGEAGTWNATLFRLRKAGRFADIPTLNRTEFSWQQCEPYLFASEIAWRHMLDQGCDSLDTILCHPHLAATFDDVARRWAPGFSPLEYRWAALKLRKNAKQLRSQAEMLSDARLGPAIALDGASGRKLPESSGIYVVLGADQETIYAGEAGNLRQRLAKQFGPKTRPLWRNLSECLTAKWSPIACRPSTRLAHQRRLVNRHRPLLNLPDPRFA
ncbi:MAG TPA: DNA methyltransferase [Pirellulales bacterium]|jgi:site-specific DNA-methyltransferase (adenine-specific)|nr:DNA methyltransferase [Pirellulales bacterium]